MDDRGKLHIFQDEWDAFVARDVDHVLELFREYTKSDYQYDRNEWERVSDDTIISVRYENVADIQRPEGCVVEINDEEDVLWPATVSAKAAAWVRCNGAGILCSTEW